MTGSVDQYLMADFEALVDELMKKDPNENRIKELMTRLELDYSHNAVDRISLVLEKMNRLVFDRSPKKDTYDLR